MIVVVDLSPPRPQPRERVGRDVFRGGAIQEHEGAGLHDPSQMLSVERLEGGRIRHSSHL